MQSEALIVSITEARKILGKQAKFLSDAQVKKLILDFDEQVQYILKMVPNR